MLAVMRAFLLASAIVLAAFAAMPAASADNVLLLNCTTALDIENVTCAEATFQPQKTAVCEGAFLFEAPGQEGRSGGAYVVTCQGDLGCAAYLDVDAIVSLCA